MCAQTDRVDTLTAACSAAQRERSALQQILESKVGWVGWVLQQMLESKVGWGAGELRSRLQCCAGCKSGIAGQTSEAEAFSEHRTPRGPWF